MLERFKICNNLDACLNQLDQNSKLAIAISYEHSQNSLSISSQSSYHCFSKSEIIYEYALKFLVRKNFPHLRELNEFIQRASASGLIEKWRLKNQYRNNHPNDMFGYLTFEHFLGIVILGCFLWILFIIFLFIERFVYTKNRTTNPLRFWVFIEMVIDPHRHFMLETNYWY